MLACNGDASGAQQHPKNRSNSIRLTLKLFGVVGHVWLVPNGGVALDAQ